MSKNFGNMWKNGKSEILGQWMKILGKKVKFFGWWEEMENISIWEAYILSL